MLTVGSLFAGIGGFDLGFERAGFEIKWQVEIDPFCRAVLAKHWPQVRRYEDVRTVGAELAPVDALVGGFPCQPHSVAGRRGGAADDRDLWPQFLRIIRDVRPRWVVAENVPGLLSNDAGRFFGGVLRDLAESGFDAEWDCLPASAFGAPHRRDRVWIVAYPAERGRKREGRGSGAVSRQQEPERPALESSRCGGKVADADGARSQGWQRAVVSERAGEWSVWASRPRVFTSTIGLAGEWEPEPDVGRVAHGVPARVDRLRGLGNAIVPQIAEWIAERIKEAESKVRSL